MEFLVEMDDELDYNESESPITVMKRTGDTKSSQSHVKSMQHSSEKIRHVVVSPREEGEAYSDDENDSTTAGELKRDYANKQSTVQVDKEEGEASSEEDRRYDHRYDSKREKISTSKQKHSSRGTNLTLDEVQYRSRLHERYERREREIKRLRSDKDTEATMYDTHRPVYSNEESNSSSGDREDVKLNVKVDDLEVGRKHQSIKAQDIRQKDRSLMPSVHQTSVDKSPPQDSRSFKAIQKEREEYGLKYSQSQTSFSKYDNVLSSTSQSVPTGLSDKIIGSENLYTSVELSHSPIEVSKKSKSKKSKRERKDREKESSKIRGDDIPLKYSKKESKQRKVHHSSSTTSELDQTTKWRESDQKYEKMISSAVRHDRLPHPGMQQQQQQPQHSCSGSLDSISSNSSQMSKASGSSSSSSSSSSSRSSPTVHGKSSSVASAHHHHHHHQHSSSQMSSSYDRDTTTAYDHRRHHRHHSKRRYHREARETAPPPEANRPYIGPNQISVKIKHKHKSDKRETMTTTTTGAAPAAAVPVDNNYPTNLLYKREKISQDIIESHQDILIEESYKHHKKSKLSKNTEIEAIASRHKKHSSKRSKSKEHRSLSQKLSSSEQTSHRHRSNLAPSKHEIGHDERYSEEESELDSNKTKEVNLNVNDKEVVMVSSKIKDTNPSSFPSGSNKQHIVEGGGGETKGSGRLSRFPPRPPRLPQYPGYSESSSESDDFGVGVSDNPFMHNPISTSSNNGADRKMDVDADEDKYKDFRDDDDDGGDGVGDNAKIDSPEDSKPPGKPFYFPSIQGCRSVEEFECLNRIEEGTYGVVYRARDKKVNEIVALKRLKMEKERDGFPITSLREINMLMKAQHENIVTVREVVVGSNMDKIYLVMDYVEHDLKSLMEVMNGPFSVGEVKCLLVQLLRAVAHLHDNWILHRDLKTSNLLLSHQGILKVGDFGLAREYGSPLKHYTEVVVTLWYRAPELLLGTKQYSCPIDLWSVGCIFAEFLLQRPLFPGKGEIDELNIIFRDLGTPTERIWPGVSQLPGIKKCVFTEYPYNQLRRRFTEKQISDQGFDLLNSFLTYCPEKRITAEKALAHPYFNERPRAIHPSMFPSWPAKSEGGIAVKKSSPRPPGGGALAAAAAAVAAAAAAAAAVSSSVTSGGAGGAAAGGSRIRYQPPAPPMGGQRFYSSMGGGDSRPSTANRATVGSGDAFSTGGVDKGFLLRF